MRSAPFTLELTCAFCLDLGLTRRMFPKKFSQRRLNHIDLFHVDEWIEDFFLTKLNKHERI